MHMTCPSMTWTVEGYAEKIIHSYNGKIFKNNGAKSTRVLFVNTAARGGVSETSELVFGSPVKSSPKVIAAIFCVPIYDPTISVLIAEEDTLDNSQKYLVTSLQ